MIDDGLYHIEAKRFFFSFFLGMGFGAYTTFVDTSLVRVLSPQDYGVQYILTAYSCSFQEDHA
jgi:hypothetical protein